MRDMNATRWVHDSHQLITSILRNIAEMEKCSVFNVTCSLCHFVNSVKAPSGYILVSDQFSVQLYLYI